MLTMNVSSLRIRPKIFRRLLVGAALLGLAASASAQAWWNDQWTARVPVTIDTTAEGVAITENTGPVPVLLRLHGGNFPFGGTRPDGSDIRVVADDQSTVLSHHVERFDDLLQEGFVWVGLPEIPANSRTTLWVYFGHTGSPERGPAPARTYDEATVLVYHFGQRGSAPTDSSAHGNHAANAGIGVEGSLIAGGLRLTGNQAVTIPASATLALDPGSPMTWSVWVSPENHRENAVVLSTSDGASSIQIGLNEGRPFATVTNNGSPTRIEAGDPVATGTWRHLAVVADGSSITLFVNGRAAGTAAARLPSLNADTLIGRPAGEGEGFAGQIDELNIARAARSEAFLLFQASNQGTTQRATRLVSLGTAGAGEGPSGFAQAGGYFAILVNAITTEGWIILWMLAAMSIFSWIVMLIKYLGLSSLAKANEQFVKLWAHVSNDLAVLDNPQAIESLGGDVNSEEIKAMRRAPMFRLYRTGVEEIRHRLRDSRKGNKKLSGLSIQAIRASMHGTFIRETQRLQAKIVYLTIAISGGPFLGLLGTVVGVTITFAAIAAAGDVNVNAIAPGVAAALTTTIAGLLVAIPALFGYNYLVTRIRDVTNDMRVFNDEFITKAAEFYSKKGREGEAFDHDADADDDGGGWRQTESVSNGESPMPGSKPVERKPAQA